MRIVHLSDIHFWQYEFHPLRLMSKRLLGMASLVLRRARRFRLERVPELVEYVRRLEPDHILITGDVTTTALPGEFRDRRAALADWFDEPARVTVIPGNHDRYTLGAQRSRRFEQHFGAFAPGPTYPWVRMLDSETAILGLDPTRPGISARGKLPHAQLIRAQELLEEARGVERWMIACHYPVTAPPAFQHELLRKPLINAMDVARWLRTIGPHLFCCGHVHEVWAYQPDWIPNQLSLNPGAPLMRDRSGRRLPGFLEIDLHERDVTIHHHARSGESWGVRLLKHAPDFFRPAARA